MRVVKASIYQRPAGTVVIETGKRRLRHVVADTRVNGLDVSIRTACGLWVKIPYSSRDDGPAGPDVPRTNGVPIGVYGDRGDRRGGGAGRSCGSCKKTTCG